ncbi:hypothetical protein [Hoeflea sp.]|uniref:hypothetical protein n=1 Tax=Hoeflea sp. TaxID=1940281 RepID=UPI003B02DDB2
MSAAWQTVRLSSGDLELVILPAIGGRLWDVVFVGRSLLFQNPDLAWQIPDLENLSSLPTKSPQFGFPLWGGEKTWIAPDSAWIDGAPFPTLDSGPYQVTERDDRQITLQSETCPLSGLEIQRRIRLNDSVSWSLRHEVHNRGSAERLTGIWSVLMLNRPTRIGLRAGPRAAAKTVFGDAGGLFTLREPNALFECKTPKEFKIGLHNPNGRVFMKIGDPDTAIWIECSTAALADNDHYAHGHNFEVFNSGDYPYCEAEWHAPAKRLKPGESTSFVQNFQMRSGSYQISGDDTAPAEKELLKCMSS